jgi:hypothetical protein
MDQVSIKYTNIFHCKTLQNLPKFGFLVLKQTIWQPWLQRLRCINLQQNKKLNVFLKQNYSTLKNTVAYYVKRQCCNCMQMQQSCDRLQFLLC